MLLAGVTVKDGLLRAGESFSYDYMSVSNIMHTDETFVEEICVKMGLREGTAYSVKTRQGQVLSTRFILHLKAEDYGFAGTITETPLPMLLPVIIEGLNEKWPAGIWYKGSHTFMVPVWKSDLLFRRYTEQEQVTATDRLLRFGIFPETSGLLQVDTEIGDKDIYIGNLLVCDNPDIFLELEDWRPGREKITVNNPTDQEVTITIKPGPGFDLMGNFEINTTLTAGGFARVGLGK
jgi:hypothetical protein